MSSGSAGPSRTTTNTRTNPTIHQLLLPGEPQPQRRPQTVIDLTLDSPPTSHAQQQQQRGGGGPEMQRRQEIIDVDALPDRPARTLPTLQPPIQTHSHFQLNYNPHYDARHAWATAGRGGDGRYRLPSPHFPFAPSHATAHGISRRVHVGRRHNGTLAEIVRSGMPDLVRAAFERNGVIERGVMPPLPQRRPTGTFRPPVNIDYEATALGYGQKTARPFEETYVEPPKAMSGFTRSPTEKDVLVCADEGCEQELGETEDDKDENDEKSLVFVGKCGHVYCGPCGLKLQRARGARKAVKGATPTVSSGICVVSGCTQKLTGKQIWKVHL